MIRNLFGGSKCRTVDVCDIFGDSSGKALYRLDGNANDESGNYHGTETAITYGGGVYERGIVSGASASNSIATGYTLGATSSISFWASVKTANGGGNIFSGASPIPILYTGSSGAYRLYNQSTAQVCVDNASGVPTLVNLNQWYHLVFTDDGSIIKMYKDGVLQANTASYRTMSGMLLNGFGGGNAANIFIGSTDQLRIFDRAITATEVAILYAECAPTSTVDNINPFEDGSLKALYQFNGDATDKTGVYNLTETNITYESSSLGQRAVFNGTSSKGVGAYPLPSIFSLSFKMVIPTNFKYAMTFGIVSGGMNTANSFCVVAGSVTANKLECRMSGGFVYTISTQSIVDTVERHYVITFSGTTVKCYINGTLDKTTTTTTKAVSSSEFVVGVDSTIPTKFFDGKLDQVRIFNKALTPMEVASLYNETTPLEEPMHSLVDPFKDGSGVDLYRFDGNGLNEGTGNALTITSLSYVSSRFGRGINLPNSTASYASNTTQSTGNLVSVSLWYKPTALTNGVSYGLFSKYSVANSIGWTLFLYVDSGNPFVYVMDRDSGVTITVGTPITTNMVAGVNYHIAMTMSETEVLTYVNGTLILTSSKVGAYSNILGCVIGKEWATNLYPANGVIDQVRVFNRALTASEVQTLYTEI